MANDAFFSFFIDVRPTLNKEDLNKVFSLLEDANKKINQNEEQQDTDKLKKKKNKYLAFFSSLETRAMAFSVKLSAFTSILGGLATLKFNNVKDFAEDIQQAKGDTQKVFDFLNASNKVAGASQTGVLQDIRDLYASKRQQQTTGINDRANLHLIGASLNDDIDVILTKYRATIKNLNSTEQKILTERIGLSQDTMRVARLSEQELKDLSKLGFYNKQNIAKLEETARATKELFGAFGDVKDRMIISFSPLIISLLSSIKGALEGKTFERVFNSLAGLGEDIANFNTTLKGIPFKALLGVMLLEYAIKHKILAGISIVSTVVQDVYNGIKDIFGFKAKKSVTADILKSVPAQTFGNNLMALHGENDDEEEIARAQEIVNNWRSSGTNNNINNNTTINIEVKGNADANTTRNIASSVKNIIENNNARFKNINDKR